MFRPSRDAALCCCLLLLPSAAGAARVTARTASGASDGAELPFNEAAALAKTLWAHTQVIGCLEASLESAGSPSPLDLVHKVWKLELDHTTEEISKSSSYKYYKNMIQNTLLLYSNNTRAVDKQRRHEEELESLSSWKEALAAQHHYDYTATKEGCLLGLEPQFNRTLEMAEEEFSGGCAGNCSKMSLVSSSECRETLEAKFCPEGTHCGCHFETDGVLGAVVGASVAAAYTGIGAAIAGPAGALLLPGKAPVGMFAAALAGKNAKGCRCILSECAWDSARGACAPAPAKGAKNPFQAVLPYVGMKCVAKTNSWQAMLTDVTRNLGLSVPTNCREAQPCAPEDSGKIGQAGLDTFNCKYMDAASAAPTLFPPLDERMAEYRRLFPDVVGDAGSAK